MARIGLDIGGTKSAGLLVDSTGAALATFVQPTDVTGPAQLIAGTVALIDQLLGSAALTRNNLTNVGAGVPGQVEPMAGTIQLAVNLHLTEPFPFAAQLSNELGVPVVVENDVRTAALGVYHWLATTQPVRSVAYLSIGTGIAAGIVRDGQIYRGAHGMAGEIGHLPMEDGGPRCSCGGIGCLEAIASGPAIARAVTRLSVDNRRETVSTGEALARAARGDAAARAVVGRACHHLARAIYMLIMTHDVERVVVGGGVSQAGDHFWKPLAESLAKLRVGSPLAAVMLSAEKIVLLPPTYNAGVEGAVLLPGHAATEKEQEVKH